VTEAKHSGLDVWDVGGIVNTTVEPLPADVLAKGAAELEENAPPPDPFAASWKWLGELGADWLDTAPAPRRWLLERVETAAERGKRSDPHDVPDRVGVLPLGKVGMLAAAGGVGKTMALVQLALAVATGRRWLGTFATPNPGPVLLALAEEDEEEVRRRVWNAAAAMQLSDDEKRKALARIVALPLAGTPVALVSGEAGAIEETDALRALRARLEALDKDGKPKVEWRLVVLDPLSRWAGADTEKDNAAATRFVEAVETLALHAPGSPTVLLAHHTAKVTRGEGAANDATAARGATGLVDGVRWVANLDNASDGFAVLSIPTKSNYSRADGFRLDLARDREHGGALRPLTAAERAAREAKASEAKPGKPAKQARPGPERDPSEGMPA